MERKDSQAMSYVNISKDSLGNEKTDVLNLIFLFIWDLIKAYTFFYSQTNMFDGKDARCVGTIEKRKGMGWNNFLIRDIKNEIVLREAEEWKGFVRKSIKSFCRWWWCTCCILLMSSILFIIAIVIRHKQHIRRI